MHHRSLSDSLYRTRAGGRRRGPVFTSVYLGCTEQKYQGSTAEWRQRLAALPAKTVA
jgi:hypothetical protein